jgi:hypothetical protein
MSNRNKYQLTGLICFALALMACSSFLYVEGPTIPGAFDQSVLHEQILKYRTWTVVNPEPVILDAFLGTLCADVSNPPETPHKDKYIRVYVNDVGQEAMLKAKDPKFPVGSIVIKEKLPEKQSQTPEFHTIMVKREAGYDSRGGDWQYLIMDSAQTKLEKPTVIESCQSCHAAWAKTSDYISRAYLSHEQNQQLR